MPSYLLTLEIQDRLVCDTIQEAKEAADEWAKEITTEHEADCQVRSIVEVE